MRQIRENKIAFSLLEIIMVVAIIGILAAISVHISIEFRNRAMAREAVTILGFVRSLQNEYITEHGQPAASLEQLGINSNDVVGEYFTRKECYSIEISSVNPPKYSIKCNPALSDNPKVNRWEGFITMDRDGKILSDIPEDLGLPRPDIDIGPNIITRIDIDTSTPTDTYTSN